MQSEVRVDWVTLTKRGGWLTNEVSDGVLTYSKGEDIARLVLREAGIEGGTGEIIRAGRGYKIAFEDKATKLQVHISDRLFEQGVMVVATGKSLSGNDDTIQAVCNLVMSDYRVSRMDIAIDVYNLGETVDQVAQLYKDVHPGLSKRKFGHIQSLDGSTVYIGSRTSNRYLRIYDKGKQQGLPIDWVRAEIEVKGAVAHEVGAWWIKNPRMAAHDINALLDTPQTKISKVIEEIGAGTTPLEVIIRRPASDRELWFRTQVVPAFRNLLREDDEAAMNVLAMLLHEVEVKE